jgi:hypothetical protein
MSEVAKLKPLASELFDFLSANLIGDYGPVLAHHDIHSIRQFSMLDAQTCRELANDASIRNKTSRVSSHTAHPIMCRSYSIIVDECLQKLLTRYFMCLDAFLSSGWNFCSEFTSRARFISVFESYNLKIECHQRVWPPLAGRRTGQNSSRSSKSQRQTC